MSAYGGKRGEFRPKASQSVLNRPRRFYFYSARFTCRFRRVLAGGNRCARIVLQLNSWESRCSARAALSIIHCTRPCALHSHASAGLNTTDGHCLFPRLPFCVSCAFPLAYVRVIRFGAGLPFPGCGATNKAVCFIVVYASDPTVVLE